MSVVSGEAIVSPPAEKLKEGCMCKVKRFEKNPAKVIAAGTKAEMNSKLNELDGDHGDDIGPPKKKARVEGKENKSTPKAKQKRRPKNQKEPGTCISYFYWVHWCVYHQSAYHHLLWHQDVPASNIQDSCLLTHHMNTMRMLMSFLVYSESPPPLPPQLPSLSSLSVPPPVPPWCLIVHHADSLPVMPPPPPPPPRQLPSLPLLLPSKPSS